MRTTAVNGCCRNLVQCHDAMVHLRTGNRMKYTGAALPTPFFHPSACLELQP